MYRIIRFHGHYHDGRKYTLYAVGKKTANGYERVSAWETKKSLADKVLKARKEETR